MCEMFTLTTHVAQLCTNIGLSLEYKCKDHVTVYLGGSVHISYQDYDIPYWVNYIPLFNGYYVSLYWRHVVCDDQEQRPFRMSSRPSVVDARLRDLVVQRRKDNPSTFRSSVAYI